MALTAHRGDPIYYNERLVARFAMDINIDGESLRWSWSSYSVPAYRTLSDGSVVPVNAGTINRDYVCGDLQVWKAWGMVGDIETAFNDRAMFLPPDIPVSSLPDGIATAAKVVKDTLPGDGFREIVYYLDYLIQRGEAYADRHAG